MNKELLQKLEKMLPEEMKSISYSDPRLQKCECNLYKKCDCMSMEEAKKHNQEVTIFNKARKQSIQALPEILKEYNIWLSEKVKENHKGTFTDEAGHDCWYVDELSDFIINLLKL